MKHGDLNHMTLEKWCKLRATLFYVNRSSSTISWSRGGLSESENRQVAPN